MIIRVSSNVFYSFGPGIIPAIVVDAGSIVKVETITTSSTIYLPCIARGFTGVGGLHVVMGGGEICVAACEVSGSR